jgi:hypothetical protein
MKEFPIKFSFAAQDYSARVTAFNQNTQFHISTFIPQIPDIQQPYVVYKKKGGLYAWTVNKNLPHEFGLAIFEAIKKTQKM